MLAFERHGSGEPLVLVHGVTHRRQAWYPVLDELAAEREVILVDLPGHGQSDALVTDGRPVADVLRETFRDFNAELGLDRPHVAGNSLGGLIALMAAAEDGVRSATALSPAGFWRTARDFAYTRRIFAQASMLADQFGPQADLLARTAAGRRCIYGLLCAHPGRVSADQAIGDVRAFRRARPALRQLLAAAEPFDRQIPSHVPVTIAWAARDLVLPPRQAEVAKRVVPHAEHVLMRGVGHVPMTDDPHAVAQILLRGSASTAASTSASTVQLTHRAPATVAPLVGVATA